SAASQVERQETGNEVRVLLKSRTRACRIENRRIDHGSARRVEADWIEGWVGQAGCEAFRQEGVVILQPALDVVDSLGIGEIGAQASVLQSAGLGERRGLVIEGIGTRIVVELILAEIRIHAEQGSAAEQVGPDQRGVVAEDVGALILAEGLLVILVGSLEPGTRQAEIQVERVGRSWLEVDAIEEVFAIAVGVNCLELRSVQIAATIDATERNEVSEALIAEAKREASVRRSERSVATGKTAMSTGVQAGAGSGADDQAGLVSVFGGNDPVDDLH